MSIGGPKRPEYEPKSIFERLAYLAEECAETIAAGGKSLRFGYANANPELPEDERETNAAWLRREIADLRAAALRVRQITDPDASGVVDSARLPPSRVAWPSPPERLGYLLNRGGRVIQVVGELVADAAHGVPPDKYDEAFSRRRLASLRLNLDELEIAATLVLEDIAEFPSDPRHVKDELIRRPDQANP